MKPRRGLGAAPGVHRSESIRNGERAEQKLQQAVRALRQKDCATAWDALIAAAGDLGAMAAHADSSSSAPATVHLRLPPDDSWHALNKQLVLLTDAGKLCFRKGDEQVERSTLKSALGQAIWQGLWRRGRRRGR